jgi:solute:Na+ symporter, SSS family
VAMSNASGALNSLAASSVLDFSVLRATKRDPAKLMPLARRMTLLWGALLIFLGLVNWGPVLEAGLKVASFPFGSLLGLFLLGTFDQEANARGSLVGMFAGLLTVFAVFRFSTIAFTWYVMIGACVTYAVGWIVSRLWPYLANEGSKISAVER